MSRGRQRRPAGKAGSRLLVCLLLFIGVLAMHGLGTSHDAASGPASASPGMAHELGAPMTTDVRAASGPDQPTGQEQLQPRAMSMLGGVCLAVLLAAGVLLLRSERGARAVTRSPGMLLRRLRVSLRPGHDPPGLLLLRLCVMRT